MQVAPHLCPVQNDDAAVGQQDRVCAMPGTWHLFHLPAVHTASQKHPRQSLTHRHSLWRDVHMMPELICSAQG